MSDDPSVHVEVLRNAQNIQIREQKNVIIHGNQNISASDQATLIELLQPILDASHTRDREKSPPNSACFPGTRIAVIHKIAAWVDSTLLWNTHVLWLYGFVGCGKSAIALAIALKFERRKRLVGSFFFFRNTGDRSKMIKFAATLACQLAAAIPEAAPFIEQAVKAEPGLRASSVVAQLRRLVYEPFKAAARRGRLIKTALLKGPFLMVIDGLDECDDRQEVQAFIDDMLEFFKKNPLVPLRFLITSRIEQHIEGHLKNKQVRLENLINHCSRDDIDTFMCTCFEAEKRRNPVIRAYIQNHGDWPTKEDKDLLVDHIDGSFIFASALFKYIIDPTDDRSTPMDRLPHTLHMNPGLDTLYIKTLSRSQHLPHFFNVISTLALLFEPLPITGIADLLGIECFEVVRVLLNLQAIIHIPGTDDLPVTMCHTSLRDFLTTESRSGPLFAPSSFHYYLIIRCCDLTTEARIGSAFITSYIRRHFENHLDAAYTHILAKSQGLPYFSNIISIITLLSIPIAGIVPVDLLGTEAPDSRAFTSLQPITDSPGIIEGRPVMIGYTPGLYDFLTSEALSGTFFISPSYHLRISYYCFNLRLERMENHRLRSSVDHQTCLKYRHEFVRDHLEPSLHHQESGYRFLKLLEVPSETEQHPYPPDRVLPYHLFSFAQVFVWIFSGAPDQKYPPPQAVHALTQCIESLVLAVECDPAPDRWLRKAFHQLGFSRYSVSKHVYYFKIHGEQAAALQRNVQHIRTKCPSGLLDPRNPNDDSFGFHPTLISDFTLKEAYSSTGNINSFAELLVLPLGDVARRCKISAQDAKIIYDKLLKACPVIKMIQLDELTEPLDEIFSTGDTILNQALGGGIRTGMLWEIVGESSAGKTQVALQLSLFVQNPPELGGISGSTCYLTTSAKLPTGRLKQIADSNSQLSPADCGLDNVHTISISTVPILQNILSNVLPSFIQQQTSSPKPVKLVIIDALTELFHSSEKTSKATLFDRSKDLNRIASALHTIAGTHNVAVVVINEVIDRFERGPAPSSSKDLIYSDKSRWFNTCNSVPGENIKEASLGLVWANQLNARIMLSKTGRRRYIDESELLQAQQQQKKARVGSGSSVQQQTQMPASDEDTQQATLVRRLSVIFSSVAPPVSMDYIITHEGFRVLPDESLLEELKAQSYGFASDESEEVAQSQNQDQNQSSTLPEPAVPAQPSQTQESKDEDEWDRYWEEEDEESKNVDWDALELSLTQAS